MFALDIISASCFLRPCSSENTLPSAVEKTQRTFTWTDSSYPIKELCSLYLNLSCVFCLNCSRLRRRRSRKGRRKNGRMKGASTDYTSVCIQGSWADMNRLHRAESRKRQRGEKWFSDKERERGRGGVRRWVGALTNLLCFSFFPSL